MAAAPRAWAADLLHFWFHELGPDDWFRASPAVDAASARFAPLISALGERPYHDFSCDPLTARAAILLFDQIPRNVFRHDARAFAHDALARRIAREVIARGWLRGMRSDERAFVGMPLMHSETIRDQLDSLSFFRKSPRNVAFARAHWRMIARFGRFPHRNPALGRRSTAAEERAVAAGNAW